MEGIKICLQGTKKISVREKTQNKALKGQMEKKEQFQGIILGCFTDSQIHRMITVVCIQHILLRKGPG